jgi:hypothetical protein
MNEALPFAQRMLAEHGEFHPYGMVMKPDGEVVYVAAYDGRELPPTQDLIDQLEGAFRREAFAGEYRATALVYDVLVIPPGGDMKRDAIAVALDHRDEDYSVVVFFPYLRAPGAVTLNAPFANDGKHEIFQRRI